MSEPLNLYDVAVGEGEPDKPEGYHARAAPLGEHLGASRLGGTVYELDPGQSICPYHYEGVEEEWVLVITGTPVLRDPDGEHELATGDLVGFPRGPDGAHKITNRTAETIRVLMFSSIPKEDISVCVYPDSEKVGVWPWPAQRLRIGESLDYWDGEA